MEKQNKAFSIQETAKQFYREYTNLTEEKIEEYLKKLNSTSRYENLKSEKEKHEIFVEECLAPKGYQKNNGQVFAMIVPPEEIKPDGQKGSPYVEYHISLVTPAMVYTDLRYFNEFYDQDTVKPWWYEEYRPYYYDLSISIDTDDKEWYRFYRRHCEGTWIRAFLGPVDKETCEGLKRTGLLRFGGSITWSEKVEIIFKDDDFEGKDKEQLLRDLYDRRQIKNDSTKKWNTYFNNVFFQNVGYTANILNVGQANCIFIENDNGQSFMFDIGVPFEEYRDPYDSDNIVDNADYDEISDNAIKTIETYKPDFIMISHWHFDHTAGFIYLSKEGLNCHWIVPELDNAIYQIEFIRLALYLKKRGNLSIIRDNYDSILYTSTNGDIDVFRGSYIREGKDNVLDRNAASFMLRIKNVLFAADCMYRYWPKELTDIMGDIDWIVVPHHGGKMDTPDIPIMQKINKNKKRNAVVCVGNNGYGHPTTRHLDILISYGFESIYITGGTKTIEFGGKSVTDSNNTCSRYFKSVHKDVIITIP